MTRFRYFQAATMINLAISLWTSAYLPLEKSYSWSNPIDKYISSRGNWDIVIVTMISLTILTFAVYHILNSYRYFSRGRTESNQKI